MRLFKPMQQKFTLVFDRVKDAVYAARYELESNLQLHGHVETWHYRDDALLAHDVHGRNIFTTEGRNFMLDEVFNAGAVCGTNMFMNIYKNNVTPLLTHDNSDIDVAGAFGACDTTTHIDEATRQAYIVDAAESSIVTNAANKAVFTIAASITVYGAFLTTTAVIDSNTPLICAKLFSPSRVCVDDDVLNVLYVITMTSS